MTTKHEGYSADNGAGDIISLGTVIQVLWRGKLIIAMSIFVGVAIGVWYSTSLATPLFRSTSVVMLNNREEQVAGLESVVGGLSGEDAVINSEAEVLRSRNLIGKVVDDLNLTADPEFNKRLKDQDDAGGSWIDVWPFAEKGEGEDIITPERVRVEVIQNLLSGITIRNIPNSLVFEITAETSSPEKSQRIADKLAEIYILNQIEVKFEATEQATEWLTDRVTELQSQLEAAETAVTDFRSQIDLISSEALSAQERQLKEIRERISGTRSDITSAQETLSILENADTRNERIAAAVESGLLQSSINLASVEDDGNFDRIYSQVTERASSEIQRRQNQLSALEASAADLESQITRQSGDLITLQQLTREAEASRLLYEHFLTRLKETSAQQGVQQADSRIISDAVSPNSASSPRKNLIATMTGILGLLLGSAFVLIREARSSTFRDVRSLESRTGYKALGQVPHIPVRVRRDAIAYLRDKPTSAASEAIRNLRTSILMSNVEKIPQVILLSSSLPGEGKTTTALALAQNFSGLGKKVLLIEGDIRRNIFVQYSADEEGKDMMSVLSGKVSLSSAITRETSLGCDILFGGKASGNAADIFSANEFASLIESARDHYDHIIIDSAPVLVVPDARIISRHADSVIFVVKWDSTADGQVIDALKMFESVGQNVDGVVLNDVSPRGMKRYGYGGSYGAYSSYGAKYYND